MGAFILVLIFAGVLLYINIVSTMKKVRKEQGTERNTLFGCILVALILFLLCLL
ncbi:hypothetical protein [Clostridium sp. UBA4548]|uniref:hypothetical protein n=1 Tax=Clostridium sp. UBA4548 TaxID=1946361 RepID=UPI0025BBE1CA|nr:hypothetical protein [Clostridium sp. UBA4548]